MEPSRRTNAETVCTRGKSASSRLLWLRSKLGQTKGLAAKRILPLHESSTSQKKKNNISLITGFKTKGSKL